MKKITAIEIQKKNPNRVNIYLDGEFAFGLTRIVAAWLSVGQVLEEKKIADLQAQDMCERAYQQGLLYLSYRARSENEIRQNLRKHTIPEAVIEETVVRLREAGFANDEQFAHAWVENRNTFRPRSRRALAMELRQKGLADSTIESALQNVDDEALAYKAGQKKAGKLKVQEWSEFRKKLSAFLARRGFSYGVIAPIVQQLWSETNETVEQPIIDNEEIT